MKQAIAILAAALLVLGLMAGCDVIGKPSVKAPAAKSEASEPIPTLEEVLVGTWNLYGGYDQQGNMVYGASGEFSLTFDADGGMSGVYNRDGGYVDSTFSGTYDVTNSKAVDKNPYRWYYYVTIDQASISDAGQQTLAGDWGSAQGMSMILQFRDEDGEMLLYDSLQRIYFKR